jgi:hypothetical protein
MWTELCELLSRTAFPPGMSSDYADSPRIEAMGETPVEGSRVRLSGKANDDQV